MDDEEAEDDDLELDGEEEDDAKEDL